MAPPTSFYKPHPVAQSAIVAFAALAAVVVFVKAIIPASDTYEKRPHGISIEQQRPLNQAPALKNGPPPKPATSCSKKSTYIERKLVDEEKERKRKQQLEDFNEAAMHSLFSC